MKNNYNKYKDWFENKELKHQVQNFDGFKTLDKIKHYSSYLESPRFDESVHYSKIKSHLNTKPSKNIWLKIAAVLIIALSVGLTSFYLNSRTLTAKVAATPTFTLPDNSEVTLAANSTIKYNNLKWKFKRSVSLTGEAYFKVSKGSSFVVQTELGQVEVLGTKFNVKQYKDAFKVTCYEGRVKVSANNQIQFITAQEEVVLSNQNLVKSKRNLSKQPLWVNHKLKFDSVLFNEISKKLKQFYEVDVTLKTESNKKFTGVLPTTDLNKALEIISQVYHLKVNKIGDKSYIFVTNDENK